MIEPPGPESSPTEPSTAERWPVSARWVAAAVIIAVVSGAVASGVTWSILRYASQRLDVGTHVTVTEENAVTQVVDRTLPAVVSIVTTRAGSERAVGSGFLINSTGYLVTNIQVVANSTSLIALIPGDPTRHDVRVVDSDCESGLAVLKIDGVSSVPTLSLADPSSMRLGQTVIALGGPMSSRHLASRGIVSGLHRELAVQDPLDSTRERPLANTIQTDATIGSDSSGGPLLNVAGQVVGLNLASQADGRPVGLALSVGGFQPEIDQIVKTGRLRLPGLGLHYLDLSAEEAALRELPVGALISTLTAGGAADRAGIQNGDLITQVDDVKLGPAHPLGETLRTRFSPSQHVTVTVVRAKRTTQFAVALEEEHPTCA